MRRHIPFIVAGALWGGFAGYSGDWLMWGLGLALIVGAQIWWTSR